MQPHDAGKSKSHINITKSWSATAAVGNESSQAEEKVIEEEESQKENKIYPSDFENFIPWACLQWRCSKTVSVFKKKRELYIPVSLKKTPKIKHKYKQEDNQDKVPSIDIKLSPVLFDTTTLVITTYYDDNERLSEIEILEPPFTIPCEIIKAINVAIPFHTALTKLTIRRGGLSALILNKIAQGLTASSITELCLDDTYVKQGNYYVLLDQLSILSYLSLSRCSINDTVAKEITVRLKFGCPMSKVLQILDLSSNLITDEGADAIQDMLRTNRCMLHINVSGNQITDRGAANILNTLKEFVLNEEEVLDMKYRKVKYFRLRGEVYAECLRDEMSSRLRPPSVSLPSVAGRGLTSTGRAPSARRRPPTAPAAPAKKSVGSEKSQLLDDQRIAEMNTNKIVGERFTDIFDSFNTLRRDESLYCIGNFTLASINFAYNNMQIFSLRKLVNVLKYQSQMTKQPKTTGLMRIVLDGNNFPMSCDELELIEMFLKRVIVENIPVYTKKRTSKDKPKLRT